MRSNTWYQRRLRRTVLSVALGSAFAAPAAWANPMDPVVVHGTASFAGHGNTLTITNSPNAIIHWQSFSIGPQELTQFQQVNAQSAVLNRVVGPDASSLLGTLQSNGRVFLINPAGILIGRDARIDVAGLVASTLNIADLDFLGGKLNFQAGAIAGSVVNQGLVATPFGGQVFLIGPQVENDGIIRTPGGGAVLAAGRQVTLGDTSVPNIAVQVSAPGDRAVNLGEILVEGGSAGLYGALVDQKGVVRADSVSRDASGRIVLRASKDVTLAAGSTTSASGVKAGEVLVESRTGTTLVEGRVAANATATQGGTVMLLGDRVGIVGESRVEAVGPIGGGSILVGGDYRGANPLLMNAGAVYVGDRTTLSADASSEGRGGRIVLWSEHITRAHGEITARGAGSGDGGFVETSSRGELDITRGPDLGSGGTWLIDPTSILITSGRDTTRVVERTTPATDSLFTPNTSSPLDSILGADLIATRLNSGTSVIVDTSNPDSTGAGDITVSAAISKVSGAAATLTLKAHGDIRFNGSGSVVSTAGALDVVLHANQDGFAGGTVRMTSGSRIETNGGRLVIGGGPDPFTNPAEGTAALPAGVILQGATLLTGAGDISILGRAANTGGDTSGVRIDATRLESTSGRISIAGAAGASPGTSNVSGVAIVNGSIVRTTTGALQIDGAGPGTDKTAAEANNQGVLVGASLVATSSGRIDVTGNGGRATGVFESGRGNTIASISGVRIDGGGTIESEAGDIVVTGTAGATAPRADGSWGVAIFGERGVDARPTGIFSAGGDITVTGTAPGTVVARSGSNNHGVFLFQDATIRATGNGVVTVTGDAGFGSGGFLEGVLLWGGGTAGARGTPTIQSASGLLRVTGIGGDTDGTDTPWTGQQLDNNVGVAIVQGGRIVSTGAGAITVTGTGGNAPGGNAGSTSSDVLPGYNRGILVYSDASDPSTGVFAQGAGSIALTGTGGSSAARDSSRNDGIAIAGPQSFVRAAGVPTAGQPVPSITLLGTQSTGHRDRDTAGVYIVDEGLVEAAGAAAVRISGTAAAAARDLDGIRGVEIGNWGLVRSATGAIEVVGAASASAASATYGVIIYGRDTDKAVAGEAFTGIVSTSGNIIVDGTGGGTADRLSKSPQGLSIIRYAGITTGGSGAITLTADAGAGDGHLAPGFLMFDSSAAGGPTVASVDGDISVTGTAARTVSVGGGFISEGVSIVSGGLVRTTGSGNIAITGTGGNNAAGGNGGVAVAVSVLGAPLPGTVEARGTGSIRIEGFAGTAKLNANNLSASNTFTTTGVFVYGGVVRTGVDVATGGGSITVIGHGATDGVDETTTAITPQIDAVVIGAGQTTVGGVPTFIGSSVRSHAGGAIAIHGDVTGSRAFGRAGVSIEGAVVDGGSGNVTITGIGGAADYLASGVRVVDSTVAGVLRQGEIVTTSGAIRVEGSFAPYIGPRTSRLGATVVWAGGRIASVDGDVTLVGRAPGTPTAPVFGDNSGVGIGDGGVVETSGRGNIVLQGHGGHSTDGLISGVYIANDFIDAGRATTPGAAPRVSATGTGDITIAGIAGGHGPAGRLVHGIFVGGAFTHPTTGSLYDRFAARNGTTADAPHASISVNGGRLALRGYGPGYTDNFAAPVLDDSFGAAGQSDGVALVHGASVTATGTGSVDIEGRAGNALGFLDGGRLAAEAFGVRLLRQARVASAGGAISVRGFADFGADAIGVAVDAASAMTTVDGAIDIRGFGGGTEARPAAQFSDGILVAAGSRIEATGTGAISLVGTGGYVSGILTPTRDPVTNQIVDSMAAFSQGLLIRGGSLVRTASGSIVLEGTAPDGATDTFHLYGLLVFGPDAIGATATRVTSATGNITLKGVGAGDPTHRVGSLSMGVVLRDAVSVSTGGLGNVSIDGTGAFGTGSTNAGVNMLTGAPDIFARVQVENGRIDIVGRAGDTTATAPLVPPGQTVHRYMHGVSLLDGVRVVATGTGSISINGTGGNAPLGDNVGVAFTRDVLVEAGAGSITIDGTAGSAAALVAAPHIDSYGVWISGATVRGAGAVTIVGRGPADGLAFDPSTPVTSSIHGVRIAFNGGVNQHTFVGTPGLVQGGTVAITGDTRGAGTAAETGVSIDSSEVVSPTGPVTITGFAGPGNGAVGIAIDATDTPRSRLHVGTGTLTLNGVGPDGAASTVPGQAAGVSIRRSDVSADAAGTVILDAIGGAAQDAATSITAGGLLVRGAGTFDLTLGNNAVQRFASDVVGTLRFANTGNLDAGATLAGTNGLTVRNGVLDVDTRGNLVVRRLVLDGADATLHARSGTGSSGDAAVTSVTRSGAAPGAVRILADRHITLDGGVIRAAPGAGALGITLAADRDADGDGAIALRRGEGAAMLVSNGGEIVLGGGLDPRTTPAVGSGALLQGVGIHGSIVDAGAGSIVIHGRTPGSITDISADGVAIMGGSKLSTTTGHITIRGDALPLAGVGGVSGVVLHTDAAASGEARTAITTAAGTIDIRGTAPGTVETPSFGDQSGVYVVNAIVRATGNGDVRVEGDAGIYATGRASGVFVANGALVESQGAGAIDIVGRGGRSLLASGGVFASGVSIALDSPGANNGANAPGVVRGASGLIRIEGFAPTTTSGATDTSGVSISGGQVITDSGRTEIVGHGAGTLAAPTGAATQGVWIANGGRVESTATGSIAITGDGGAAVGVLADQSSLNSPGRTLFGTFRVATARGVLMEGDARVSAVDGDITITGTPGTPGSDTVFNDGVHARAFIAGPARAVVETTGAGSIRILGDGSAATVGGYSQGVNLGVGSEVRATGAGAVTIEGRGATATFTDSTAIPLASGGQLADVAAFTHGVLIVRDDFIFYGDLALRGPQVSTDSGTLTVIGRAGQGTATSHSSFGVDIYGGLRDSFGAIVPETTARVTTGSGAIVIDGTAAGTVDQPFGRTTGGVLIDALGRVTAGAGGTITITGDGGYAGGDLNGLVVAGGGVVSTIDGALMLHGTAGGLPTGPHFSSGVWLRTHSSVSTVGGRISIIGTGGGTVPSPAAGNSYGVIINDGADVSGGDGSIGIDGTGGVVTTGADSFGVSLQDASVRTTSGNIGITGRGTIGVEVVNGLLQAGGTSAVASLDAQAGRLRLAGGVSSRGRIELRSAAGVSMENDGDTTQGAVDADELLLLGTGDFALEANPLRVARLAGDVAGDIRVKIDTDFGNTTLARNGDVFSIATVGGTDGLQATRGGAIEVTTVGGAHFEVQAPVRTTGVHGAAGATPGGSGLDGTAAGAIALRGIPGMSSPFVPLLLVASTVESLGGSGGRGADGAAGANGVTGAVDGSAGGAGGAGGRGGDAGNVTLAFAGDVTITGTVRTLHGAGGDGGNGGAGGDGLAATRSAQAGNGGDGGAGGNAGDHGFGGRIQVSGRDIRLEAGSLVTADSEYSSTFSFPNPGSGGARGAGGAGLPEVTGSSPLPAVPEGRAGTDGASGLGSGPFLSEVVLRATADIEGVGGRIFEDAAASLVSQNLEATSEHGMFLDGDNLLGFSGMSLTNSVSADLRFRGSLSGFVEFLSVVNSAPGGKVSVDLAGGHGTLFQPGAMTAEGGITISNGELWMQPYASYEFTSPTTISANVLWMRGEIRALAGLTTSGTTTLDTSYIGDGKPLVMIGPWTNTGTIVVPSPQQPTSAISSELQLLANASLQGGLANLGTLRKAADSVDTFTITGRIENTSDIARTGSIVVESGTLALDTLVLGGGTVSGPAEVAVASLFDWSAGAIGGGGRVRVRDTADLLLNDGGATLDGTLVLEGDRTLGGTPAPGQRATDGFEFLTGSGVVDNVGTLTTGASGGTSVGISLVNHGTITVDAAAASGLSARLSTSGTFTNAGTVVLRTAPDVGAATLEASGGVVNLGGALIRSALTSSGDSGAENRIVGLSANGGVITADQQSLAIVTNVGASNDGTISAVGGAGVLVDATAGLAGTGSLLGASGTSFRISAGDGPTVMQGVFDGGNLAVVGGTVHFGSVDAGAVDIDSSVVRVDGNVTAAGATVVRTSALGANAASLNVAGDFAGTTVQVLGDIMNARTAAVTVEGAYTAGNTALALGSLTLNGGMTVGALSATGASTVTIGSGAPGSIARFASFSITDEVRPARTSRLTVDRLVDVTGNLVIRDTNVDGGGFLDASGSATLSNAIIGGVGVSADVGIDALNVGGASLSSNAGTVKVTNSTFVDVAAGSLEASNSSFLGAVSAGSLLATNTSFLGGASIAGPGTLVGNIGIGPATELSMAGGELSALTAMTGGTLRNAVGGELSIAGDLTIGSAIANDGTLRILAAAVGTGAFDNAGTLELRQGAAGVASLAAPTLRNSGTILSTVAAGVTPGSLENLLTSQYTGVSGGRVSVGAGAARLAASAGSGFDGTLEAAGGRLGLALAGTAAGSAGTLRTAGAGDTIVVQSNGFQLGQGSVVNGGTLRVLGGALTTGTLSGSGTTDLQEGALLAVNGAMSGATLLVGDGTARLAGAASGIETIHVGTGTLATAGDLGVTTLTLGGGMLDRLGSGAPVITVASSFGWNGGTVGSGVDVTIAKAATLTLAGANTLDGALTLLGSTSVTALGSLGGTGSIVNRGAMIVANDLTLAPRFVNERVAGDASTGNLEVRAGAGAGASFAAVGGVVNEGGTITLVANGARAASLSGGSAGVSNRGTLISRGEGTGSATAINVVTDLRTSGVVSAESAALRLGALQGSGSGSITADAAAVTFDLAADYVFSGTVDIGAGGGLAANSNGQRLFIATLTSAADLVAANGRYVLGEVNVTGGRGMTVAAGGDVQVTGSYGVSGTTLVRDDGALRLEGAGTLSELAVRDTAQLTVAGDAIARATTLDGGVVAIETGRRLAVSELAMDAAATVEGGGRLDVLAATTTADNFRIAPGATIRGTIANFGRGYIGSLSGDATGMLINAGSLTLRDTGPVTIAPRFRNDADGPLAGTLFVDRPAVFLGSVENRGDVLVQGARLEASGGLENSGTLRLSGAPAGVATIAVGAGTLTNRAGGMIVSGNDPAAATALSATNRIEGVLLSAGTIRTRSEHLTLQTGAAAPGSNTGAFEVVGGDMTLVLGNDFVNTGTIATGPGHRFSVQAGTHTFDSIGGSLATADALTFDRGTVKLGALAITSNEPLSIRAGTLVTVDGAFAVPGITTVSEGSTLHLSGGGTAGAMVVDGAALVVDSQPLTMDTLSLRGGSVHVGTGGGIVTDLLAQTGGTIRVGGSLTPALARLEGGLLEVLAGGRLATPTLALSPGVVLNGAGDLLVTDDLSGDESGIGSGFRNLTLTKSGDFDVARPYAATGTLGLRSTAGRLLVNGVSVSGNDIALDGANVQVGGGARSGDARVTAASDLDVRTGGELAVDGSNGAAKLLAGGRIGITAANVRVDAGSHGASIDPDEIAMDLTGTLALTGGTRSGAAADVTGRTIDITASSITLAGGSAPGTEAVIAATGGDMRLAVSGVALTGGAGADADALLFAPAGVITLTGLDCSGCTVVTTNPRGDGLTSAGAFALAFSRSGSFDPPAAGGDDEGFDSAISGVNQALDAARRLQNLEVLTEEERNDGKGKRLALRLPSCR